MNASPSVLVAHESDALLAEIREELVATGFSPVCASDGHEAKRLLDSVVPAAAVLDVGLGSVLAFELIEYAKATPALVDVKFVLVASVYNRTAYKRKPVNLYGADDYVEQHHIGDMLAVKLCGLLGIDSTTAVAHAHEDHHVGPAVAIPTNTAEAEKVRATAHSIVADIALYHSNDIESVIAGNAGDNLQGALAEGRRVLEQLIPKSQWPSQDPVLDAFRQFIEEMRRGGLKS